MKLDHIHLTGIRGFGYHGVLEHERRDGQEFIVDLVIGTPKVGLSAVHDDLSLTLDYREVLDRTHALITGAPVDLIETLAERIADSMLAAGASDVTVTVHKPSAPLSVPVEDVAVRIHRRRIRAVIGLGANLGDAVSTLRAAAQAILLLPRVRPLLASSIYRTAPVGPVPQPDYCNAILIVQADWDPQDLLQALHGIEAAFDRSRVVSMGPRSLDLDLIDVSDRDGPVNSTAESCRIPHPHAAQRRFVLEPWVEVEPEASLGWLGPLTALLAELGDDQPVARTGADLVPQGRQ